jgi:hypothetical protein
MEHNTKQYLDSFSFIYFFGGTQVWIEGLFSRQLLYHLIHAPGSFCFRYFPDKVSCFGLGWPGLRSSYLGLYVAGMTVVCHHDAQLVGWNGILLSFFSFFCRGWPWVIVLPISTSRVSGTTGVPLCPVQIHTLISIQ